MFLIIHTNHYCNGDSINVLTLSLGCLWANIRKIRELYLIIVTFTSTLSFSCFILKFSKMFLAQLNGGIPDLPCKKILRSIRFIHHYLTSIHNSSSSSSSYTVLRPFYMLACVGRFSEN